jgi:5-methyltetrahydropteroyltriglutamate--homocysteine methyltransferase
MVWDRAVETCRDFFDGVKSAGRNVETALHLHSGNHRDFLEIESLDILEFHSELLDNPPVTARELERHDKFLQIGVASTANLVELEPIGTIRKRLKKAIDLFGDRVKYVSPDCGLKGLINHETALELLRMVSQVTQDTGDSQ